MAIVAPTSLGTAAGNGTISKGTLSISGSNLALIVGTQIDGAVTNTVSTMNWDDGAGGSAQALTQIGNYQTVDANANTTRISLWGLLAPSTSNSRVIATYSDGGGHSLLIEYYTGVIQAAAFTAGSGSHTNGVTSYSQADTSDADGSWHIGFTADNNGTISMGTGSTAIVGIGTYNQVLVDSNAAVANTVSHTFNWNQAVSGAREAWVTAMMRPAAAVVASATRFDSLILMGVS